MTIKKEDKCLPTFLTRCAEHGLKITPQRTVIYEALFHSKEHPTADSVYKKVKSKLPNISFDTVNRTLLTFSKINLIHVVEGYGEAKRFEPDLAPHHHFRCVNCNSILDFQEKAFDSLEVPTKILKKFKVLNKKVLLEGLCDKCQKTK